MMLGARVLSSTLTLLLAGLAACQSAGESDPPLQSVPLSRGSTPPPSPPLQGPARTGPAALPANHPPIPSSGQTLGTPTPPMAMAPAGQAGLQWTTPAGWVEEPPSSAMRLTQWRVGASQPAGPAECAILRFAGAGGSVEDNIGRWIGQFTQPDGSASADRAVRGQRTINGLQFTTLELAGTFQTRDPPMSGPVVDMPGYAMYGAIIETAEGPYFLKCTGPESTMGAEEPGLEALLQSFSAAP